MINPIAQKHLYIIFSETPTRMGGMIRRVTHNKYNHVSIALDREFSQMYSFARHYQDTPLYGGFVRESAERYQSANVKVCDLSVSEEQYDEAKRYIDSIAAGEIQYLYNIISAACFVFHRRINIRDAYTCIEFIINVLRIAQAPESAKIPSFCSLRQLETIYGEHIIYEGKFPRLTAAEHFTDDYTRKNPLRYRFGKTISSNSRLLWRFCCHASDKKGR